MPIIKKNTSHKTQKTTCQTRYSKLLTRECCDRLYEHIQVILAITYTTNYRRCGLTLACGSAHAGKCPQWSRLQANRDRKCDSNAKGCTKKVPCLRQDEQAKMNRRYIPHPKQSLILNINNRLKARSRAPHPYDGKQCFSRGFRLFFRCFSFLHLFSYSVVYWLLVSFELFSTLAE